MEVVYYIKHPNGREKIEPTPAGDEEAIFAFQYHWTAKADWTPFPWAKNPKPRRRALVKETKVEISEDYVWEPTNQ